MHDLKFKYDDSWRQVSNPTFEWDTKTIIGFEMRKGGKFSYKIKRYLMEKIHNFDVISPEKRKGPVIGLPYE